MMNDKVRLVGGPGGGKVINHPRPGANDIVVRVPKKMTRKKRFELMADAYSNPQYYMTTRIDTFRPIIGMVEARYTVAVRTQGYSGKFLNISCQHPDGSIFYEYVEGSRRDC